MYLRFSLLPITERATTIFAARREKDQPSLFAFGFAGLSFDILKGFVSMLDNQCHQEKEKILWLIFCHHRNQTWLRQT